MRRKTCFKCNTSKPLEEYYKHAQMSDGHLNKCKDCTKKDASKRTIPRKCLECGKDFMTWPTEIKRGGGLTCSRSCYYKRFKQIVKRDKDSPNWKGDTVGYAGVHDWVRKQLGRPRICQHCQTTSAKSYDWANISKNYLRELSDWKRLCRKCHIEFDDHPMQRKATMMQKYGTLNIRKRDVAGRFSNESDTP